MELIEDNPNSAIDELEINIRNFIDKKLSESFGQEYWKKAATPSIQERVKAKLAKRAEKQPTTARENIPARERLDYCDVMDYYEIIVANWSEFSKIFGAKTELQKHFLQLKEFRNALKHSRSMNNVERKQGEASYEWLYEILIRHQSALAESSDSQPLVLESSEKTPNKTDIDAK